jgi:hypothetical protein
MYPTGLKHKIQWLESKNSIQGASGSMKTIVTYTQYKLHNNNNKRSLPVYWLPTDLKKAEY